MKRIAEMIRSLVVPTTDAAEELHDGGKLISRIDMIVEAKCPCGSATVHVLALHGTADCRRCNRTFAIRSIEYFRPSPRELPDMRITIGYVVTRETLRRIEPVGAVQ